MSQSIERGISQIALGKGISFIQDKLGIAVPEKTIDQVRGMNLADTAGAVFELLLAMPRDFSIGPLATPHGPQTTVIRPFAARIEGRPIQTDRIEYYAGEIGKGFEVYDRHNALIGSYVTYDNASFISGPVLDTIKQGAHRFAFYIKAPQVV